MPEFATPHSVKASDKPLTNNEMIRAIRFAIASEYEAIQIYEEIIEAIDNKKAITMLEEVISDEKIHVGNFMQLLKILNPKEESFYREGYKEALEILNEDKK